MSKSITSTVMLRSLVRFTLLVFDFHVECSVFARLSFVVVARHKNPLRTQWVFDITGLCRQINITPVSIVPAT